MILNRKYCVDLFNLYLSKYNLTRKRKDNLAINNTQFSEASLWKTRMIEIDENVAIVSYKSCDYVRYLCLITTYREILNWNIENYYSLYYSLNILNISVPRLLFNNHQNGAMERSSRFRGSF